MSLEKTQVTDAGLASLTELINLEALGLADTAVTDAGLDILDVMPSCAAVLGGTKLTDAGMSRLRTNRSPDPDTRRDGRR